MEREKLKSRLGFILLSAGCAIGIGNVWKFPYMAGQGGGGAFVLSYLLFLVILGLPIMTMEFAVGRASHKSPVRAYQALEKPGQKWHIHGYFTLIGCYLLMMFYTTIAGWLVLYFVKMLKGDFVGLDSAGVSNEFSALMGQPGLMALFMVIVVVLCMLICSRGLQNGVEKVTKVMMLCLLAVMVVLVFRSVTLEGAGEGLKFYLMPNFHNLAYDANGNFILGEAVYAAMGQAFFTLSLGIGALAIFGSYIDKRYRLTGEALRVAGLDTLVAIMAGLIIFPACFAFGVEPGSGPGLVFITLPSVFSQMPVGQLWGTLFFLFMTFASFTTVIAVFENLIATVMDQFGWTRRKTCLAGAAALIVLGLPCALGFNLLSGVQPLGPGSTILDFEDFLVSNLLLPVGSLIYLLFCVTRYGWGWDNYKKEVNTGKGLKMHDWMRGYLTYGLPLIVLFIFVFGLYDKFIA